MIDLFFHSGSVYSVMAISLERFYNICKPNKRSLGSILNGQGYIFAIIVFSVVYNIIKFFEFETVTSVMKDDLTGKIHEFPQMNRSEIRQDPLFATPLLILNSLVVGVVPIAALTYLHIRITSTMNKTSLARSRMCSIRRQNHTMIALLTGIVVVLVVCHTPKTVIDIYECYQMILYGELRYRPLWMRLTIRISNLLLCVSTAVNIIIYSYKAPPENRRTMSWSWSALKM